MNKLLVKLGTGAVSAAVFMSAFAGSAFASTELTIDGNGTDSKNVIKVSEKCKTEVTQKNNTDVKFKVNAKSSTGGNEIDGTTGDGDVTIDTGDATTTVNLTVTGGSNTAEVPDCCCNGDEPLTIDIKDNGNDSVNKVKTKKKAKVEIEQKAKTKVKANVKAKSKTGKNEIKDTTGSGDVEITTGDATTEVVGEVTGGDNNL